MKTQKIVLVLALAAVTPAVLSAQDYVGGPGSKMSYIADNALARIRQNHKESNPQTQEPVKQQTVAPQQQNTAKPADTTPVYYPYGGREGHMLALENLGKKKENKQKKDTPQAKPVNDTTPAANTQRTRSNYNPYVGPEGHRAAIGNAVRDARQDSTPTHIQDIDTVSRNHQATLDQRTADKSTKKTNGNFRQWLGEVGRAIAQEAPFMK